MGRGSGHAPLYAVIDRTDGRMIPLEGRWLVMPHERATGLVEGLRQGDHLLLTARPAARPDSRR